MEIKMSQVKQKKKEFIKKEEKCYEKIEYLYKLLE